MKRFELSRPKAPAPEAGVSTISPHPHIYFFALASIQFSLLSPRAHIYILQYTFIFLASTWQNQLNYSLDS